MPEMTTLFPLGISHYLIGGLLIGGAVTFLFVTTGLIGGMSSVYTTTWSYISKWRFFQQPGHLASRNWRLIYAAGLILGAAIYAMTVGETFVTTVDSWQLALGGFVAGFGARLGGGCTSGHGICGLASLQLPSLLAVLTFLTTAMITAQVVMLLGAA